MAEMAARFQAERDYYPKQRDFALNFAAYLEQNRQYGSLMAILEAGGALNGATSDLLSALEDYPPRQYAPLLRGGDALDEVAPYLINLQKPAWAVTGAPLTDFTDWLFADADFARLGVFFVSRAPFADVKAFWRKFSHTRVDKDKTAYFRFYNPRFFNALLNNMGSGFYQSVAAVAELIFYFDCFNSNILHVYHFYPEGWRAEQFDLGQENTVALASALFAE